MMFRKILLPTDGSPLALKAVRAAARLAREQRAPLVAFHVTLEGTPSIFSGGTVYASGVLGRQYERLLKKQANDALAAVEAEARRAGVAVKCMHRIARHPWRAILAAARGQGCDLIIMSSHGRSGLQRMLLGSETAKVLAHATLPVLVYR
jgi:nucleotide-binding universal stress UspA family protein